MRSKRIFDLVFAFFGVALLSPLFAAIALWVRFDSTGPAFFRQARVGRYGRLFRIFKFRTMCIGPDSGGRKITVGDDSRITRAGRILRKFKLDELPQLFNVLKGEMSIVGPRPELPEYVALYPKDVRSCVLSVPPGITDFASILYKDESAVLATSQDSEDAYVNVVLPEKLKLCVRYVSERTIWLDIKIVFLTLMAITKSRKLPMSCLAIGVFSRSL